MCVFADVTAWAFAVISMIARRMTAVSAAVLHLVSRHRSPRLLRFTRSARFTWLSESIIDDKTFVGSPVTRVREALRLRTDGAVVAAAGAPCESWERRAPDGVEMIEKHRPFFSVQFVEGAAELFDVEAIAAKIIRNPENAINVGSSSHCAENSM